MAFWTEWTVVTSKSSIRFVHYGLTWTTQPKSLCNVSSIHYIVTIHFHEFPIDTRDGIVLESQKTDDRPDLARTEGARWPIHLKNSPWLNTRDRHAWPFNYPVTTPCTSDVLPSEIKKLPLDYRTLVTLFSRWPTYMILHTILHITIVQVIFAINHVPLNGNTIILILKKYI